MRCALLRRNAVRLKLPAGEGNRFQCVLVTEKPEVGVEFFSLDELQHGCTVTTHSRYPPPMLPFPLVGNPSRT